jgi:hypothetical protein
MSHCARFGGPEASLASTPFPAPGVMSVAGLRACVARRQTGPHLLRLCPLPLCG